MSLWPAMEFFSLCAVACYSFPSLFTADQGPLVPLFPQVPLPLRRAGLSLMIASRYPDRGHVVVVEGPFTDPVLEPYTPPCVTENFLYFPARMGDRSPTICEIFDPRLFPLFTPAYPNPSHSSRQRFCSIRMGIVHPFQKVLESLFNRPPTFVTEGFLPAHSIVYSILTSLGTPALRRICRTLFHSKSFPFPPSCPEPSLAKIPCGKHTTVLHHTNNPSPAYPFCFFSALFSGCSNS